MMTSPIRRVTHRNAATVIGFIEESNMGQAYQERVLVEAKDLREKIDKLNAFVVRPDERFVALPEEELGRLRTQMYIMRSYHAILAARIAAFRE